jgi:uncharacterized protein with beta-barrel porin domain
MAGSGSCVDGSNTISGAATDTCWLDPGDSLNVTGTGSITDGSGHGIYVYGGSGSITNAGTIEAGDTGLYLYGSLTQGNVVNSGTITSDDNAVYVYGSSTITGNFTNSGTISANQNGVYIYGGLAVNGNFTNSGTIDAGDHGMYLYGGVSTIGGNFVNSGLLDVDYAGIYIYGGSLNIQGDFINSGTIHSENGHGIYVYGQGDKGAALRITGDLINSGLIDTDDSGIYIYGQNSMIGGDLINSGTILGGDHGIYIYGAVHGNIENSGTIESDWTGIYIHNSGAAAQSISNTGTIISGGKGIAYAGNVLGDVTNSGYIYGDSGIYLFDNSYVGGNLVNSGTISAGYNGLYVYGTIAGNIENSGTIISGYKGIYLYDGASVGGDILNSGVIDSEYNGIYLYDATVGGSIINTGTILSDSDHGIYLYGTNVGGNIENSGLIKSDEGSIYLYRSNIGGSILNSGTIFSEGYRGLYIYGNTVIGGDVNNSGYIYGGDTGIYIHDSSIAGDIINSGTIIGDNYRGIYLYGSVGGDVINTGTISSGDGYASIYVHDESAIGGEIRNSGTLLGHLQIDAYNVDVTNSGLLHTMDDDSYIEENYTQSAEGTFRFNADNSTTFGTLDVDETGTFAAGSTLSVDAQVGNTLADGDVLNNVVTAGTLDASTFNVTDNLLALSFTAAIDGDTVDLTAADTGMTTVAAALGGSEVATELDAIMAADPSGELAFAIGSASTVGELEEAVEATQPALAGGVALASIDFVTAFDNIVNARQTGIASGDHTLMNRNFWLKGYGSFADQDKRDGVSGYDVDSYGFAAGVDGETSANWTVGAAISYTRSDVESKVSIGSHDIDADTVFGKIYATNKLSADTVLNLQAGIGFSDFDSKRVVASGDVASADYDAKHFRASAEWARMYQRSADTTVSPYVRAEYRHVDVDGYTESGAGAFNLDVDDDSADSLILGVGVRGSHTTANNWVLTGDVGIGYDAMTDKSSLTASYEGGTGAQFTVDGMEPSKLVYNLGLGAKYQLQNGTEIRAGYDLNGREDYTDQSLSVKARWKF